MKNYDLSFEEYRNLINSLYEVSGMILQSFAKSKCDLKNLIIRNFIARVAMMLKAILKLYEIEDYQDAWIIHRALLDRLFHLKDLCDKNGFKDFDDWSFFEQYKAQNRVRSDKNFKHEAIGWEYESTNNQKERLNILISNPPKWKRPKAEEIAKSMNLYFLYDYGYDFASTHVHPMANDGNQDFFTITKLESKRKFTEQSTLLLNSILASSIFFIEALNNSSFRWRKIVFEYLNSIINSLKEKNNSETYDLFIKLNNISKENELCEKII